MTTLIATALLHNAVLTLGLALVPALLLAPVRLDRVVRAGLLGIPEEGTGPTRRLMVLRSTTGRLAVPVDEVQHTHRYHDGELMPVPVTVARSGTSYTQGVLPWGDRKVSSLDAARLLDALDRSLV